MRNLRISNTLRRKSYLAISVALALLIAAAITGLITYRLQQPVSAADLSNFKPGNIISDATMSNKNSMTKSQIQSFLKSKASSCTSKGPYSNGSYYIDKLHKTHNGTRAETTDGKYWWYINNGHFVCMADASLNGESAADIIYNAAHEYNINPQVIIVLLQKEQGLITDAFPNSQQYNTATGFGCPDTAACDTQYYGLKNQVRLAANLFRTVLNGGWSNYPVGRNYIQYNPSASCGGSYVNIENRATSALYRYTPYQPNQAALAAGYGTAPCGAYGNRNFYLFFNDWFGSPRSDGFVNMDVQRWMQIKSPVQKVGVYTYAKHGPILEPGRQIRFIDKILVGDEWLLRTEWDKARNNPDGIPLSSLQEIPSTPIPPVWKTLISGTFKTDPIRQKQFEFVEGKTAVKVVDRITVNGKTYYRTEWEQAQNRIRVFPEESLSDYSMTSLIEPRHMVLKSDTSKVNVLTGQEAAGFRGGSIFMFNKRITVDGVLYVQPSVDTGTDFGIPIDKLHEATEENISSAIVNLDDPRWMTLKIPVQKKHMHNNESFGPTLSVGRHIKFIDKIYVNNEWLLRTDWDATNNNLDGIPLSSVDEITVASMQPTQMKLVKDTHKVDPLRGLNYEPIPAAKYPTLTFVDKITIDGATYYRTQWEKQAGGYKFIPKSALSNL